MQTIIIAKAVLINERGEVLIMHRSASTPHRPGDNDLPGGSAEPGEDVLHAVVREIAEETGFTVRPKDLQLVFAMTRFEHNDNVIRCCFIGHTEVTVVTLSPEHDSAAWLTIPEAKQALDHLAWGEALRYIEEYNLMSAKA
jgi:8-oxo-dGTP pyrophosphatase MutT (NUDIX family)